MAATSEKLYSDDDGDVDGQVGYDTLGESTLTSDSDIEHLASNDDDLSVEAIGAWRDLCLAQAQEIAWQKAVLGELEQLSLPWISRPPI
jgi:hypothetical protein